MTHRTLVVVNARVRTADPRRVADAVVVRDGVVLLLGASAEARKLAGPDAHVVDARGATLTGAEGTPIARGDLAALFMIGDTGPVPVESLQ